jgi:hypothetical protein
VARVAILQDVAVSLARRREVVEFARGLVPSGHDRVARVAALFTFVGHLAEPACREDAGSWDGVEALIELAGEDEGPAVMLCALLLALGERARIVLLAGVAYAEVALERDDLRRLPPHAAPIVAAGRLWLPLDPRRSRVPLGFLPAIARRTRAAGARDLTAAALRDRLERPH